MAKRKQRSNKKSRQDRKQTVHERLRRIVRTETARNQSLDTLRGMAIALMVIDHFCYFFGDARIAPDSLRIMTRLSMPLFCILTGFLALRNRGGSPRGIAEKAAKPARDREDATRFSWFSKRWRRLAQVVFASALLNVVLLREMGGRLEILASILVGYVLLSAVGLMAKRVSLAVVTGLAVLWSLFPWDFSREWFDYPLSIVISCMAVGVTMQWRMNLGLGVATATTVALCLVRIVAGDHFWVSAPSVYVMLSELLAAWLVAAAVWKPKIRIPVLTWVGRFPLSIYVGHYLLFYLIHQWIEANQ